MDKDVLLALIEEYSDAQAVVADAYAIGRTPANLAAANQDRDTAYAKMVAYIDEHIVNG